MSDQTHDPWKRFDNALESGYDNADGLLVLAGQARAADAQIIAQLREENATLKADVERLTLPLVVPSPAPTEDDINRLEGAAWAADAAMTLVWYRDTIDMLRQRLRETEVSARIDVKAARSELSTLRADLERREREAVREGFMARGHAVGTISNGYGWKFDVPSTASQNEELKFAAYLAQRQEPPKP